MRDDPTSAQMVADSVSMNVELCGKVIDSSSAPVCGDKLINLGWTELSGRARRLELSPGRGGYVRPGLGLVK